MYRKLGFGFIVVCFIVLLTACDGMPAPGGGIGAEPSATAQGRPVVIVNAPPDGSTVPVGSEVLVDSTALDAVGVARVDLAVNGSVVRSDSPPDGTPLAEFDALQPWLAEELGVFLLSLTAYRADGTASEPVSLTVNVAEENGEGVTGDEPTVTATADLAATGGPTHTPTGPTPTGGGTPTYTPTATATLNVTATYTPTSTLSVTSTATPTPTYTPTSPPAAQVAPEDARFNSPLTIPLDSTASVTDFVSYPGGDREDRVAWDISGMNSNAALSGGRAQLTIAVSCFGTGTQQIQFFTGGQTFSCGQTIVDREVTSDSRTGQVTITAVGGENTYVQWVLTGTATRLN